MTVRPPEPLAVVGAGYVGLVNAVGLAELGHRVHCIETNPQRLDELRQGRVPFFEPGLEDAMQEHRDRLHFSDGYEAAMSACRLFLVTVGTPTSATGEADLGAVWSVVDGIPLHEGQALVMRSTVPPGTGVEGRRRLGASGRAAVEYVSCPEFLSESSGLSDFRHPDRVVIGDNGGWAGDAVAELFGSLTTPDRVVRTDTTTAETLKLAANAFLAAKISFINELANVCDAVGADATTVARGVGLDPRIGPLFLRAGIGFGGSCFGKDLMSLGYESRRVGATAYMVDAALAVNDRQWERVLDKLITHLGELRGRTVAVLGLAFKPGTSNVRDANSIPVLAGLNAAGVVIRAYDPKANREMLRRDTALGDDLLDQVRFCDTALDAIADADAAVLVTEWTEIVTLAWTDVVAAMSGRLVVDGRNALDPETIAAAGLVYEGIGRPSVGPVGGAEPAGAAPREPLDLSVVVLAWDNLQHTRACVDSVRRHTDVSYELIIVDNGSERDAADYAASAADIAVLNQRNLGFAAGMNQGLAAARGRHVAFCNNDTVMPPSWASRLVETADGHPRAGIVVPALTAAGTPGTVRSEPGDAIVVIPPFSGPPPAVVYLMPRLVVDGVDGWGEEYLVASGEDVDIGFKVWVNGLDIVFDERVLVDHVGKVSASKLDDWPARWAENRQRFLQKWAGDAEVPRIPTCDEETFARNRAIAASVADWMTKYFRARDKAAARVAPAGDRDRADAPPSPARRVRPRAATSPPHGNRAARAASRGVRQLRRHTPPVVERSVRAVLVRLRRHRSAGR